MSQIDSHAGSGHHNNPHLAHHFDTPQQQFESGKFGMWLFLITEVLLFSGLFCAYAVYRSIHPEIFRYAGKYLDPTSGLINSFILITSGLTMALAIRFAQLGKQFALILCLILTIIGGLAFLGIHGYEYYQFDQAGLLWGKHFNPKLGPNNRPIALPKGIVAKAVMNSGPKKPAVALAPKKLLASGFKWQHSTIAPASLGPRGVAAKHRDDHYNSLWLGRPDNVHIFFGIYFVMTGLHALHVIAGLIAIIWILFRAIKGEFGPKYFTPVDNVGLYWGLVDLIWIFLFPLLYLIH